MHILKNGVKEINEKTFIGKLFCKHKFIEGEKCSPIGMTRISGQDIIKVCVNCGKVIDSYSINY